MIRYLVSIYFYTDGDWWFEPQEGPAEETYLKYYVNTGLWGILRGDESKLELSYEAYQLPLDEPGYVYAFGFESYLDETKYHEIENTLLMLKKDLHYVSHEWIREDFDKMIDKVIAFIKKGKPGKCISRLKDANWQPSMISVIAEEGQLDIFKV